MPKEMEAPKTTEPDAPTGEFFDRGTEGGPPITTSGPASPELVEYEVNGRKLKLDKAAAEAITEERNSFRREIETVRSEIRQTQAPKPAPITEEDPYGPDFDARFFESPSKAARAIEERAYKRATKDLTDKYQTQRSTEMFWDEFYRDNPALDRQKDDWVTKAIVAERQAELAPLPVPEAKKRLAQYTSERLMDIHKRYAPKDADTATTTLEGGSPPTRKAPPPKEDEPIRLGDYIRQKKEFRRNAELKRTSRKEA